MLGFKSYRRESEKPKNYTNYEFQKKGKKRVILLGKPYYIMKCVLRRLTGDISWIRRRKGEQFTGGDEVGQMGTRGQGTLTPTSN